MVIIACIVGFMGPFGTFSEGDLLYRIGRWTGFLAGAYVLVRPVIAIGEVIARHTALPRAQLLIWGVLLSSFPVSLVWAWASATIYNSPMRYPVILPFSLICALAVLAVVWWAERMDLQLHDEHDVDGVGAAQAETPSSPLLSERGVQGPEVASAISVPRLRARLSVGFQGPILALQSEDHYVRVHGETQSELILIRLRDAIAEIDGIAGAQVHRSWWIAREAVGRSERAGRSFNIHLKNGMTVPVARESIDRLRQTEFIS
jgi:hypothetical protein